MTNQTSGKELVSAGHAFAKAISMDTPLIVIAKMVSDLSTRLDCALARGNALQKERDALAAENAALKEAIETHKQGFVRCECCGEENMCHTDDVCRVLDEIPATDAFLNAVRADAIDEFGAYHNFSERLFIQQEAKKYAAQLRAPKGDSDA